MLGSVLRERVKEQVGQSGNAIDIAMRVLLCKWLDLDCGGDRGTLLKMQREDGGWDGGWMYRYG